jgi:peptidoglycan hydrolase-like protein with peptidoglycan-binding domain
MVALVGCGFVVAPIWPATRPTWTAEPSALKVSALPGAMNHVYVTETLDAATSGAKFVVGECPGRIYIVEPTGAIEDDPNVTDKKLPGYPTCSYRTREPVGIVGEATPRAAQRRARPATRQRHVRPSTCGPTGWCGR